MTPGSPVLTVHRSAGEIGGNCVEVAYDGHRLILDAGSPLDDAQAADTGPRIPGSLDTGSPVDALVISHPHQDHYGILRELPSAWPVWCGAAAEILMKLTAGLGGNRIEQSFSNYRAFETFRVGPFSITPHLTDHSAFDAYMLLVECGGKRILYSGDFRRIGRKGVLVDRMMDSPPTPIDVLLLEGTTLGRADDFPTEAELEEEFVSLFHRTKGRVFVTWSAQNIDRTVTIYRACKRTDRPLVLDLYTLDVLDRLSKLRNTIPRLGSELIIGVVTKSMMRLYQDPRRLDAPGFVKKCAESGNAISAAKLKKIPNAVVMLRPSLLEDMTRKGLTISSDDAWVFSMWSGYLKDAGYERVRKSFDSAGAAFSKLHTSGHASKSDLMEFAGRMNPRHLVPIHSFEWDSHLDEFPNVRRLKDGEPFTIP